MHRGVVGGCVCGFGFLREKITHVHIVPSPKMEFLDLWLSFMKNFSLFCFGFRISSRLKSLCAHSFPFSSTHFAASVDFYILFFIIFFAIAVHCLICVAFVFVFLFWIFDYVAFFSLLSTFSSHFTFWEVVLPNSDNSIGCLNRIHINLMSTRPHAIRTEIWAAVLCVCVCIGAKYDGVIQCCTSYCFALFCFFFTSEHCALIIGNIFSRCCRCHWFAIDHFLSYHIIMMESFTHTLTHLRGRWRTNGLSLSISYSMLSIRNNFEAKK